MNNTVWKRMIYHGKDLGDYYLVSNTGEIKGVKTGKIRKKNINHEGYYFVSVSLGSRDIKPSIKIHRAVAETFLVKNNDLPIINHKDGNKLNNNINNLEFCTYQYNTQHAIKNNLFNPVECGKLNKGIKRKIMSVENSKVYDSITDAGTEYNPSYPQNGRRNISMALNNHNKKAYGMSWVYI